MVYGFHVDCGPVSSVGGVFLYLIYNYPHYFLIFLLKMPGPHQCCTVDLNTGNTHFPPKVMEYSNTFLLFYRTFLLCVPVGSTMAVTFIETLKDSWFRLEILQVLGLLVALALHIDTD